MRRVWWVVGIGAFLVFLYVPALPGDFAVGRDDEDGIAGTYTVNGVDATGLEYSGTVVITGTEQPDRYDVEWIITNAIQEGSGLVEGSTFTATWTTSAAVEPASGRSVYEITDDGRLVGERFLDTGGEPATEELFPEA